MRILRVCHVSLCWQYPVFDIELKDLESEFSHLLQPSPASLSHSSQPYTVLFINPDKMRMAPAQAQGMPYLYRYRYDGGASCSVWLTKQRAVVIDLSAGPTMLGQVDGGEGTVSAGMLPIIPFHFGAYDANGQPRKLYACRRT